MPYPSLPVIDAVNDREEDIRSVKSFQSPHPPTSLFQVVTTIGGLLACYAALFTAMSQHIYSALLLLPVASGLAIRTFTLQHDCGHGSLFRSAAANRLVGRLCSLLTNDPLRPLASASCHPSWRLEQYREPGEAVRHLI